MNRFLTVAATLLGALFAFPALAQPVTVNVPVTVENLAEGIDLSEITMTFAQVDPIPESPPESPTTSPTTSVAPTPVVVLTFDQWKEAATEAYGPMQSRALAGTYFVTPSMIDNGTTGPSTATLLSMKEYGWEIAGYTGVNMVTTEADNRIIANSTLKALKDDMWARGFPISTIAPAQRSWNTKLIGLARGMFDCVRVADNFSSWLQLPLVENPLDIRGGGTSSLSSADTIASLSAQVDDLITEGGAWIVVIHRVSNDGTNPSYTINHTVFGGFLDKLAAEVANDNIEVKTFKDLCTS